MTRGGCVTSFLVQVMYVSNVPESVITLLEIFTLLRVVRLLKNINKWREFLMMFVRISPAMGKVVMAHALRACIAVAFIAIAYIVMACVLIACIVVSHMVMAYIVMAFLVMAYIVMARRCSSASRLRCAR